MKVRAQEHSLQLILSLLNGEGLRDVISSKGKGREKEGGDNEEERVLFSTKYYTSTRCADFDSRKQAISHLFSNPLMHISFFLSQLQ
eukprot:scaffold3302_cov154-Chaetoceros_neogracile.AAC.1